MSSITDFLHVVQPAESYTELRIIKPPGLGISQFYYNQGSEFDMQLLQSDAADYDEQGCDVYFGVVSRKSRYDGTAANCESHSYVLWADLDAKHNALGKKGCLDALLTFPVPASVIVDSGHGYHAYWKLDRAYPFPDCQKAMKGIAKHLGGDAVYDQPRVLRLPGTHNHKDAIPLPVRTIRLDETRVYALSDFDEWVRAETEHVFRNVGGALADDLAQRQVDRYINESIHNLAQTSFPKGVRSESIFRLILLCLRKQWEPQEIVELIMLNPIGEKAREKGPEAGRRYLERSIAKAQRG